jgi:hypothetical protein
VGAVVVEDAGFGGGIVGYQEVRRAVEAGVERGEHDGGVGLAGEHFGGDPGLLGVQAGQRRVFRWAHQRRESAGLHKLPVPQA